MPTRPPRALGLLLCLGLAACSGGASGSSGSDMGLLAGERGDKPLPIPGDVRRQGREGFRANEPKPLTEAQQAQAIEQARARAERLWQQAERIESRDPEEAGDIFNDIAENYPVSLRAGEAKYREARAYARAGDMLDSFTAYRRYMEIAPTNPHLTQIEQGVFDLGKRWLASIRGISGLFKDEEQGYAMLQWVADTFPNGALADDALFTLAEELRREGDKESLIQSVQHYRTLLQRYPRCDVAAEAHIGLGTTYEARDQGTAWHGGYVDVDPREPIPDDPAALANAGPVVSALEMAAYEYQGVFGLLEHCPSLVSESQRARAAAGLRRVQERLAAKDERIGASYGGRSAARARPYYAAADARRRAAAAGSLWIESDEVERALAERRRLEEMAAPVQPMPGQAAPVSPPPTPFPSPSPAGPPTPQPTPPMPTPPTPTPYVPPPTPPPGPGPSAPPIQVPTAAPPTPGGLPPPVVRKVSSR